MCLLPPIARQRFIPEPQVAHLKVFRSYSVTYKKNPQHSFISLSHELPPLPIEPYLTCSIIDRNLKTDPHHISMDLECRHQPLIEIFPLCLVRCTRPINCCLPSGVFSPSSVYSFTPGYGTGRLLSWPISQRGFWFAVWRLLHCPADQEYCVACTTGLHSRSSYSPTKKSIS